MAKTLKSSSGKYAVKAPAVTTKCVCNVRTGEVVTVRGLGALKSSKFKIKKGVNLLKPIAEQALIERPVKQKAVIQRLEKRKAG